MFLVCHVNNTLTKIVYNAVNMNNIQKTQTSAVLFFKKLGTDICKLSIHRLILDIAVVGGVLAANINTPPIIAGIVLSPFHIVYLLT
jgi:hypothetical protein